MLNHVIIATGYGSNIGGGGEKMKTYAEYKAETRQAAIDWQASAGTVPLSWGELASIGAEFERLARRYGLIKEFKDNGII